MNKCVWVQQPQVLPLTVVDAQVISGCKTNIFCILNKMTVWIIFRQDGNAVIGRMVVDNPHVKRDGRDQLLEAMQTLSEIVTDVI